jgi:hypothetical protein
MPRVEYVINLMGNDHGWYGDHRRSHAARPEISKVARSAEVWSPRRFLNGQLVGNIDSIENEVARVNLGMNSILENSKRSARRSVYDWGTFRIPASTSDGSTFPV